MQKFDGAYSAIVIGFHVLKYLHDVNIYFVFQNVHYAGDIVIFYEPTKGELKVRHQQRVREDRGERTLRLCCFVFIVFLETYIFQKCLRSINMNPGRCYVRRTDYFIFITI